MIVVNGRIRGKHLGEKKNQISASKLMPNEFQIGDPNVNTKRTKRK